MVIKNILASKCSFGNYEMIKEELLKKLKSFEEVKEEPYKLKMDLTELINIISLEKPKSNEDFE